MSKLFNKLLFKRQVNKKGWIINAVETDPTQEENDTDISIKDTEVKIIIAKEQGFNDILTTLQVDGREFSFVLNDEIIKYINKLKDKKEVQK